MSKGVTVHAPILDPRGARSAAGARRWPREVGVARFRCRGSTRDDELPRAARPRRPPHRGDGLGRSRSRPGARQRVDGIARPNATCRVGDVGCAPASDARQTHRRRVAAGGTPRRGSSPRRRPDVVHRPSTVAAARHDAGGDRSRGRVRDTCVGGGPRSPSARAQVPASRRPMTWRRRGRVAGRRRSSCGGGPCRCSSAVAATPRPRPFVDPVDEDGRPGCRCAPCQVGATPTTRYRSGLWRLGMDYSGASLCTWLRRSRMIAMTRTAIPELVASGMSTRCTERRIN